MNFVSVAFLAFLACAGLIYYVLPKVVRPFWLLTCSYLFYTYEANNAAFAVLLLVETAIVYAAALSLDLLRDRSKALRRMVLILTLVLCLGCLVYYKYTGFLLGLVGAKVSLHIAEPLGISYFTFAALGYLLDVYRKKLSVERNFFYMALFVSFFPCIVAGPIERAGNMLPQFRAPVAFDYNRVTGGMFRILWGFFKKLVIANTLRVMLTSVFGHMDRYPGPVLLLAALGFSYYLYCDFSALSDIAIGTGAMFGLTVLENFKRPLAACTFGDLWRRWHISLSGWFRDYLYISLGGNRKGRWRAHLNQMIVFAVSGLWHGASLGYLLWGVLNGVYLCVGKETQKLRSRMALHNPLYFWKPMKRFLQSCVTYILFSSCIVFFATEVFGKGIADGMYLYAHLFNGWTNWGFVAAKLASLGLAGMQLWVLGGSILLTEGVESPLLPVNTLIRKMPVFLRWPLYFALILMIFYFGEFGVSGFVYQAY